MSLETTGCISHKIPQNCKRLTFLCKIHNCNSIIQYVYAAIVHYFIPLHVQGHIKCCTLHFELLLWVARSGSAGSCSQLLI